MKDQAEKLRQLMKGKVGRETNSFFKKKAKVVAVTSGKGGVGKTNFAINLAISIKRLGYKVLVLDADLGLANIEILTGINIKYTIADLLASGKRIDEIVGNGPEGIKIISGGTGLHELSIMNDENIERLLTEIERLESLTDFIIIDTGAGISNTVLNFVMAADEAILITTPDPTSIMDGYTMIKALTNNGYRGKLNIVTNIVNSRKEAMDTFNKLNKASNSFLKIELYFLGYLEKNNIVSKAVKNQTPFVLSSPKSTISKRINIMALKFIDSNSDVEIENDMGFTQKLKNLLFRRGGS
ncbi:Site-determining protein [[Clostridium] ultunense Esp]|uniref:Site-determining protein n=1 Tax=[Clostridium] ultunense Esp TaxID=1288971 RepID=M1Z4R9_9FIRM|nr:MinD/ParA family protein [Schnuerera ultunensis]CCQ93031.1 Site-determining protein [[Clostridium] ultunense Esp]SHD77034.1 Site-determining protein [[Clostridium] ultunense Esp]